MGFTPYSIGNKTFSISIKDDDPVYRAKVSSMLDTLATQNLGLQLLHDITNTGRRVAIIPTRMNGGNRTNTQAVNGAVFYRLRAAFLGAPGMSVQGELGRALMGAAQAGWTMEKICLTLAEGMAPATVRTSQNLRNPTGQTEVTRGVLATALQKNRLKLDPHELGALRRTPGGDRRLVAAELQVMIEKVADGKKTSQTLFNGPRGQYKVGDQLVRFLWPWLRAGAGNSSQIEFNPDIMLGCMGENNYQKRPPVIGLAHELCHAWRNAVGQRLFDDAVSCGLDDDEVMTTGFPPYQYEKYSENKFRQFLAPNLPLRLNYR
jgi:hypothetical protein